MIMEEGRKPDMQLGFVMSQSGNPVCMPQPWRSKSASQWKYFKNHAIRGEYFQVFSDCSTFTMMRDSSVLKFVDNGVSLDPEDRVREFQNLISKIYT